MDGDPKTAMVVENHPKLVEIWARRYITLYIRQGADVAKKWALEFLPAPNRQAMVERVNELNHKDKE